jgi:hypothetical protein
MPWTGAILPRLRGGDPWEGLLVQATKLVNIGAFAFLADLIAGTLAGAKLKLFVNDVDPGPAAVIGDFTLASFVGSTPLPITPWSEAYQVSGGGAASNGPYLQWDYDSGLAQTVYGVVITKATDELIGYARLDVPKSMSGTSDSIGIIPRIVVGPAGWGTMLEATIP